MILVMEALTLLPLERLVLGCPWCAHSFGPFERTTVCLTTADLSMSWFVVHVLHSHGHREDFEVFKIANHLKVVTGK